MVTASSCDQIYQIESICPMCGRLISICGTGPGTVPADVEQPASEPQPNGTNMEQNGTNMEQSHGPVGRPGWARRRLGSSMGMGGLLTWAIVLLTFVHGVLSQQNARDFINGLDQPQTRYETPERVRELANIFELIQSAAAMQRQQQTAQQAQRARALNMIGAEDNELPVETLGMDQYETSMVPGPAMPLGMLMQNRELQNLLQQQEYNEVGRQDKRGSYMALCHFKICNMGRKRTSKWTPWLRTENI